MVGSDLREGVSKSYTQRTRTGEYRAASVPKRSSHSEVLRIGDKFTQNLCADFCNCNPSL